MAAIARLALAIAGFVAALLAVASEDQRVGWAAVALLVASLLIRLLHRGRPSL